MQPVIDPADWSPEELKDVSAWSYRITEADADELANAIATVRRNRTAIVDITRGDFPLGRFGEVHEVTPTAVFLASDDATYYVGQTLGPNGGDVML